MKPSRESQRVQATHAPSPALRWLLVLPLVAFVASVAPSQAADPIASSPDANSNLTATLLNPPSPATSNVLFRRLAPNETGITSSHVFPRSASSELLQDQGAGAGVCIADFDADGLPDLFVTHYDRGNRLYRNRGGWRFEDVSRIAGIEAVGRWCSGASAADVDGDGDLDIAVAVFGAPGLIFVNQGGGRFVERASELGLGFSGAGVAFAFADYDRDGRLDAYLVTHRLSVGSDHRLPRSGQESLERSVIRIGPDRRAVLNPRYDELFGLAEKAPGRAELFVAGQRDRLFRNTAGSGFRDVSEAAGIRGTDVGLAGIWWDYDQDGFPDLYVSNDYKGPDRLFRNLGDGTFRDVAAEVLPLMPLASMGSDVADIDNDGHLDLLATEMAGSNRMRRARILEDPRDRWFLRSSRPRQVGRNALYLGTGTEQVLEAAFLAGIARTDWTWSPKFGDFDNDGWTDLFVANGMSRDYVDADLLRAHRERGGRGWREAPVLREANLAYRNLGGLAFREVGKAWGLDTVTASFGAACGDLDRDGDLDLVVMNFDEPLSVFRNESTANHRLLVRLRGTTGNTFGVGARVVVRTGSFALTRTVGGGSGFLSANEPVLHFGLGEAAEVSELAVHWPNGGRSSFARLPADRLYEIREPATTASTTNAFPLPAASTPPRFVPLPTPENLRHRERAFDDFEREPLLSWGLSRFGPGLAVGDVDGDGLDDVYLGAGAGSTGRRVVRAPGTASAPSFPLPAENTPETREDMGAVFFDADADGDLDLYVVAGGVEAEAGSEAFRDRLYLGDGRGAFAAAPPEALPDPRLPGTVVAAGDIDRDGDLDLFVGGGTLPGHYPEAAPSRLLVNHRGTFRAAAANPADATLSAGGVAAALWTDIDDDGWTDLVTLGHWGPIRCFRNDRGRLVDATSDAGLADRTGWWNGIAAGDVDEDGDIDYVVTNLGENTRYRASAEEPLVAFHGAFDESGSRHWIETESDRGILYTARSFDALSAVIPHVRARFGSYREFAEAPLDRVFDAAVIGRARRYEIREMSSGILFREGPGRFRFGALPRVAQIAPAFGPVLVDADGDGHLDLVLAQNFSDTPPESGPMNGGLGFAFRGNGRGGFEPWNPGESGVAVRGDGRCLAVLDLDGDAAPDLLVGRNDDAPVLLANKPRAHERWLRIRLRGRPGNTTGAGARVTVDFDDGTSALAERAVGGGYLSQSGSTLHFGLGSVRVPKRVRVRWATGETTEVQVESLARDIAIREAAAHR